MGERALRRLLAEGSIERVEPDMIAARHEVDTARLHIGSARTIAGADPTGAFAMAYDAMRKAVAAHMRAHGYRVTRGAGHHRRTAGYAAAALDHLDVADHIAAIDALRQLRNQSEYDALAVDPREVDVALLHAGGLVEAIAEDLGA